MKECSHCHIPKSLDEFSPKKGYQFDRDSMCRACVRLYRNDLRRRHGIVKRPKFLERIWNGIQICEHGIECPFCCWPWQRSKARGGYGHFTFRTADGIQRGRIVTRVVYEIWNGMPIPEDMNVLHHCDFTACCNFMHFFLGTYIDNMQDCLRKGRTARGQTHGQVTKPWAMPKGESHGMAKLTRETVIAARIRHANGTPSSVLSRELGVSHTHMNRILRYEAWTSI